jgi:hypothetical protein
MFQGYAVVWQVSADEVILQRLDRKRALLTYDTALVKVDREPLEWHYAYVGRVDDVYSFWNVRVPKHLVSFAPGSSGDGRPSSYSSSRIGLKPSLQQISTIDSADNRGIGRPAAERKALHCNGSRFANDRLDGLGDWGRSFKSCLPDH